MASGGWKCEACGARFRSISSFDSHRTGEYAGTSRRPYSRRCLSLEDMRAKGMTQAPNGNWFLAQREQGEAA
jgi:hypothetical protein